MEVINDRLIRVYKHHELVIRYKDIDLPYYIETLTIDAFDYVTLIKLDGRIKVKKSDKKKIQSFIENYFKNSL